MFDWIAKGKKENPQPKEAQAGKSPEADVASVSNKNEEEILAWLVEKLAALNALEPAQIDVSKSFSYYGLDSVAAVGLAGELEEWLEKKFSASLLFTLLFSRPSLADLAKHLSRQKDGK